MKSFVISAVLYAALLSGCAGTPDAAWRRPVPLHGVVYEYSGAPLGWVELRVDDGPPVHSDLHGRFSLPPLAAGRYTVTARKPGYETVVSEVWFTNRTDVLYLRLRSVEELSARIQAALDQDRTAEAIELLELALPVALKDDLLRYLLALAHARGGDTDAALAALEWFPAAGTPAAVVLLRRRIEEETVR